MINASLRALGFLWSLPVTLLGALLALLLCAWHGCLGHAFRARGNRGGWVLEVWLDAVGVFGMRAVTFGHVQLYALPSSPATRLHEDVHTFQCDLLGVLMVSYFLFFAASFAYWLLVSRRADVAYWFAYHGNPFERWARAWAKPAASHYAGIARPLEGNGDPADIGGRR